MAQEPSRFIEDTKKLYELEEKKDWAIDKGDTWEHKCPFPSCTSTEFLVKLTIGMYMNVSCLECGHVIERVSRDGQKKK